jgi:glycosyltransferase involved in cell wall biosynthesis
MKKVLFITYYWPPAGGAPINRIFKFSQYITEFGWEPVILTTYGGDFPFVDESLLNEVDPNIKVYRSKGLSLHKLFSKVSPKSKKNFVPYGFTDGNKSSFMDKISRWVKYNFIPDTRFPWYFKTVDKAIEICKTEKIDLIFSSSPPQTNHIIAKKVSQKLNIPWVADFRDPWTDVFWILEKNSLRWKIIQKLDKRIERKTIAKMDAIVTVGNELVKILNRKTDKKVNLIYNGFDERYFKDVEYSRSEKFRIIYAGSISKEENPDCFFKSLEKLKDKDGFLNDVEIIFLGNFPVYLHDLVNSSILKDKIVFSPYTFYADSIKFIINSELSFMIIPDTMDNGCILTSKLFEYLGAGHPILAYGPVDGDAAKVINETSSGKMFNYSNIDESSTYIYEVYNKWKANEAYLPENAREKISSYSRRNLSRQLAEVFDRIVAKG